MKAGVKRKLGSPEPAHVKMTKREIRSYAGSTQELSPVKRRSNQNTSSPRRHSPRFKNHGQDAGDAERGHDTVQYSSSPDSSPFPPEADTELGLVITLDEDTVEEPERLRRKKEGKLRNETPTNTDKAMLSDGSSTQESGLDEDSEEEFRQLDRDLAKKSKQHNLTSVHMRSIIHEVISSNPRDPGHAHVYTERVSSMKMFSCWAVPSDEDEPHRRVNEPEKKVKKRKWWQRRQKVEMRDVEGGEGNEVKGEKMGQGVGQKVLEDQVDQIPKMEKQVVLGKTKHEKKVKKRKWWQRRQKVEMQDMEGKKGNEVKGEEMEQRVGQNVLEDQADQTPKMEKQVYLEKNKHEKTVKKRKWWQRRHKVEMQDVEGEKGNEVMVERESEGLENQVPHVEEQVVLENQTEELDEPAVLVNQIQNLEKQVAQESQMDKLDERAVLVDQKLVKKMVLVTEIVMREVEVQVAPLYPMPNLEDKMVLKNQAQRLEKQVVLLDPMPNLGDKMVLKNQAQRLEKQVVLLDPMPKLGDKMVLINQAQRLEKQVVLMDHMANLEKKMVVKNQAQRLKMQVVLMDQVKHVEDRVVLQNHMQNMKVQAVQTNQMKMHEKQQVVRRNQMQNQMVLMVEQDQLVGMGDWMNKMVKHLSKNMVLMVGTYKPERDLMNQSGTLVQVGLQDQRDNLEAQVVLRNQKNKSNKWVVLVMVRKILDDMDEAPEHQWTELQDPAALKLLEEQNLDRGWTGEPLQSVILRNISKVALKKSDLKQPQGDVLVPPIVEAQPEESGALMETEFKDEGVSEVEENQPENHTPSTGYKVLKGFVIGAAVVLTVIMASRRLPSIFRLQI